MSKRNLFRNAISKKSINVAHYNNVIKDKNHTIISTHAD